MLSLLYRALHLETKTCGRRFLSFGRRPQNTNLRSQVGVKGRRLRLAIAHDLG